MTTDDEAALRFVGSPEEFVRVVEPRFADQARNDFELYVRRTLSFNQRAGGRYNPPCEFGALYIASDERTAWAELHARFVREGIPGLPPRMGLVRITVRAGQYVDFVDARARDLWGVRVETLQAGLPTSTQRDVCWQLGRDVRAVADFRRAPSARAGGANVPLFVAGRQESELRFGFSAADPQRETPDDLRQRPAERWD